MAPIRIDGGQCQVAGSFVDAPEVTDLEGREIDPSRIQLEESGYYVGEPVIVSVSDANQNLDPGSREFVTVDITTTTGDAETLRLQETGTDTGRFAMAIQSVPMPPEAARFDCRLSLADKAQITASYTDTDYPLDALTVSAMAHMPSGPDAAVIRLDQSVSRQFVEVGDFVEYTLQVSNTGKSPAFNVVLQDLLPPGMRFRGGSLRVGQNAAEASVGPDGRSLALPIGNLIPGASATATFVAEVGAGARGPTLLNHAIGEASAGLRSNETDTVVAMRKSLLTDRLTIIGRVLAGACEAGAPTGVAGVRLLLDDGTYVPTDADGAYHFEGVRPGTHVVQVDLATVPPGMEVAPCRQDTRLAGRGYSRFVEGQGGSLLRADFHLRPKASQGAGAGSEAASPFTEQQEARRAIVDDATASGAKTDWLARATNTNAVLFPSEDHNPRLPVTRLVVSRSSALTARVLVDGRPVDPIHYEGARYSADKSFAVDSWNNIPLKSGDTLFVVEFVDAGGAVVETIRRTAHYADILARVELVPEQSVLVADGLHPPVVAVRMLDRAGRPLRAGMNGRYSLAPPYEPWTDEAERQRSVVGGVSAGTPHWIVEGDDGIAYITLQPTSTAGRATLGFEYGEPGHPVRQEVSAWLKTVPRDWVVVGFASGSVGYETLADNMEALEEGEDGSGVRGDGQVSLYAKGRVLGKWMLTLAYDSDKPTDRLRDQALLSTIDPGRYYTLYGDATRQGYDAASARKLYLKLERDQFYAMFGDFQTGLDRTELSRYQRTLNGVKVAYQGPLVEFNGFAARTAQSYARDELQGDGTSGLYRLTHRRIVLNSERVRIETRDRYHNEQILEQRDLVRHVDYDIDYDNGTLFFRETVASRDFDFNPNWIVVEYETTGTAEEFVDAGGRVGVRMLDDRLQAGLSYVRDEDAAGRSALLGVDARFRITASDEVRAEAAHSRGTSDAGDASGSAWLLEWTHRGEQFDLLAYARRQSGAFGLGQQNATETGMFKVGAQGQYRLDEHFSLRGEAYRMEDLSSGAVRDAASAEVVYQEQEWSARAGLQWARDEALDGRVAESRQLKLGASRYFLGHRLELDLQGDFSLGGKNDSVDFPTRLQVGAAYRINEGFRIIAAQEFTDGKDLDTSTTRLGFEAKPWSGSTLTTTLNQSSISEYGPRTFALLGLDQKFSLSERWSLDVSLDSSRSLNESGDLPVTVDPAQPIQVGGMRDGGALTEDFIALSTGATYRAGPWSWNTRLEGRRGDNNDRYGLVSNFLRQATDGMAFAASVQAFSQDNADGGSALFANAQMALAYRPFGSRWSILDKLEFRLDELKRGAANSGENALPGAGDTRSRRLVNNFVLNYMSDAWDGDGNVLSLEQRSQLSLYYGSKYVLDSFGSGDYAGYTDAIGAEWRVDLGPRLDIGVRATVLHSWSQDTYAWAFGPSLGFSPFTNAWVSVGYNVRGFEDRDFQDAHHTAQGPYLVFRMKFDQQSLGLDRAGL
jgi:uncharacterized repeat protein (TIGR01451 family)